MRSFLAVAGLDINNPDRAEELRDHLEWLDERRKQLAQEKVRLEVRNQRQRDMRYKVIFAVLGFFATVASTVWVIPYLTEIKWPLR